MYGHQKGPTLSILGLPLILQFELFSPGFRSGLLTSNHHPFRNHRTTKVAKWLWFWGGIPTVSQIFHRQPGSFLSAKSGRIFTNPGCHQPSIPPRWKNAMILKGSRGQTRKNQAKPSTPRIHTQNSWDLWTCPNMFPQKNGGLIGVDIDPSEASKSSGGAQSRALSS